MESSVRVVKSLKKLKLIAKFVTETPEYITPFLLSPSNYLLLSSSNDQHGSSPVTSRSPPLGSPFNELGSLGGYSNEPRLIQPPQSDAQNLLSKFERIKLEIFLKDSGFDFCWRIFEGFILQSQPPLWRT